ncbi:hypothetical protein MLD38_028276 [Melastoma candidum]|uniref:Uncharacterized protein n=1 Tax=Melastoma candidum TaxID=119954 RepID=A0ACB9N0K0_9MYRT|nr:hypothetical protein MLD38_028276 [Melastoma candidum]
MAEDSSVDVILDFLRKNKFKRAEAALRSELSNRGDINGFLQNLTLQEDLGASLIGQNGDKQRLPAVSQKSVSHDYDNTSAELIIKEIEYGTVRNGSEERSKGTGLSKDSSLPVEPRSLPEKAFSLPKGSGDSLLDRHSWKFSSSNGPSDLYPNDYGEFSEIKVSELPRLVLDKVSCSGPTNSSRGEDIKPLGEKKTSRVVFASKGLSAPINEPREIEKQLNVSSTSAHSRSNFEDKLWSKSEEPGTSSSDTWKDCYVKTVFPPSKIDIVDSQDCSSSSSDREWKKKAEIRLAIKEEVDEVGRALFFGKTQGSVDQKNMSGLGFPFPSDNSKEELPRLPPVKLKSVDKSLTTNWEGKYDQDGLGGKLASMDNNFLIGSYLDVPVGQEINSSGGKRLGGGNWLSVSQGIAEDTSDLVSGFATVGDGLSESIDYPNEYWDSDEYDDDDDVGYMRQPIEDEAWFLAHEIDYPSDNEKGPVPGSVPDLQERNPIKDEDEDQSFAEEDSYFSGERLFQGKNIEPVTASDDPMGLSVTEPYGRDHHMISQYDGQLMDEEELNLMRSEPVWQGFVTQSNELIMLADERGLNDYGRPRLDDLCVDDDQHGSVRSIGVGINSDAADIGSEVRESLVGGSSEGDLEYFHEHDVGISGSKQSQNLAGKKFNIRFKEKVRADRPQSDRHIVGKDKSIQTEVKGQTDGGFSFPPSIRDGQLMNADSGKALWLDRSTPVAPDETEQRLNALMSSDEMLVTWKRKSSDSSSNRSSRDGDDANAEISGNSSPSSLTNYGYSEIEKTTKEEDDRLAVEEDPVASLDDEEAAAVQEQVKQIKAQEEEFETFNLKIVHRKNRTGFEEDKNFHVVLNSVIAGRYHVTEYLGSAAFSKAIQAHDLHSGMDVCVKIIKNNKDFFDQSLDEIKLLKYVNKHDPGDKYHILRLYDYFYYREHLLIVCELLKANLYEFHKFNRESGGEVYFTMPRLQSITVQCLEALQFLHGLGLIHCDLKPENILVKSYSRCEVKVIDLGSSCFETDHLCSYVQSRSYRAPEVILGLPYDKKIDIWSLGCILAELCTGNVLFQNDSPATLLARVIGITGPIDQGMLAKGKDTYKYFTKSHMLYERNQDTNRLEYLIPKKSSLRHRLPMGDQGFIDFVVHLLEVNPKKRPSASEALNHPWLSYPYEPISS